MLACQIDVNHHQTIAPGYEEIFNSTLSALNRDFVYLNRGKTVLDLYNVRGSDHETYFMVEEWTVKDERTMSFSCVDNDDLEDHREFVCGHIYTTKQEAIDHASAKLQEHAFQGTLRKPSKSIFE